MEMLTTKLRSSAESSPLSWEYLSVLFTDWYVSKASAVLTTSRHRGSTKMYFWKHWFGLLEHHETLWQSLLKVKNLRAVPRQGVEGREHSSHWDPFLLSSVLYPQKGSGTSFISVSSNGVKASGWSCSRVKRPAQFHVFLKRVMLSCCYGHVSQSNP